jgi:hypothetical protein|tara:strand:- start:605 stop:826 length:222 start_codon:yes stop_codon:yes gene_type:complete
MSDSKKKTGPKKPVAKKKEEAPKKVAPKKEKSFSEAKAELQKEYADAVAADPKGNLGYKAKYLEALAALKDKA